MCDDRLSQRADWKPEKPVLMLKVCDEKGCDINNFQWPQQGYVEDPSHHYSLIGLPWGKGSLNCMSFRSQQSKCFVWECEESEMSTLNGGEYSRSCRGNVLFSGDFITAVTFLYAHPLYPTPQELGHFGKATGGDYVTVVTGHYGTAIARQVSTSISGNGGESVTGHSGRSMSGIFGAAITGDYGIAISEADGVSVAGKRGTAITGIEGTAMADYGGTITILCEGGGKSAKVKNEEGVGKLLPNVFYKIGSDGKWQAVAPPKRLSWKDRLTAMLRGTLNDEE